MRAFITGAAGFIGSSMADRLLQTGHEVVGYDNMSTGQERFLEVARPCASFELVQGDILDAAAVTAAMHGCDFVFHFAANADVRFGTDHPSRDLEQNTIGTFRVLDAMRVNGVHKIAFSSTGSVYGQAKVLPTPEDAPFPIQTSLYGAAKSAGEGLIAAFCEGFGFQSWMFRFVSILGERYSHGHVYDFYKQLLADPTRLHILGNGRQRKSYLYVQDCVTAMLTAVDQARDKVNILNLGTDEYVEVNDSVAYLCEALGITPERTYSGGERGWIGDNPFILLDCSKMRSLGWAPTLSIRDGLAKTLAYLQANRWLLEARA
ncbi:MAG: NAD-dependent epimerase/dehydratase family protein [Kofleriaceae bacterium]